MPNFLLFIFINFVFINFIFSTPTSNAGRISLNTTLDYERKTSYSFEAIAFNVDLFGRRSMMSYVVVSLSDHFDHFDTVPLIHALKALFHGRYFIDLWACETAFTVCSFFLSDTVRFSQEFTNIFFSVFLPHTGRCARFGLQR